MQITNINISNFKSYINCDFEFKKLNLILGPNNSGKSNLIKLLLLKKQTFLSSLRAPLLLNGSIINFGTFRNISYNYNEKPIKITYKVVLPFDYTIENSNIFKFRRNENSYNFTFEYFFDNTLKKVDFLSALLKKSTEEKTLLDYEKNSRFLILGSDVNQILKKYSQNIFKITDIIENLPKLELKTKKGRTIQRIKRITKDLDFPLYSHTLSEIIVEFSNVLTKINKNGFKIEFNSDNNFPLLSYSPQLEDFEYHLYNELLYRLSTGNFINRVNEYLKMENIKNIRVLKNNLKEIYALFEEMQEIERNIDEIGHFLYTIGSSFNNFYKNLFYIGPIRENPQRFYSIIGETARDVGFRGQFVPHLMKKFIDEEETKNVFDKIEFWLNRFEMAKTANLKRYKEISELISILCKEFFSGIEVNITDMGFGTSQVLPIIIEGYLINKNSTLIVEQPEIHLHPKAQSTLGDLFIDIANQEKNVIIETHSEHIIRRIQRRVAENLISHEDIILYYVNMTKEGSIMQKLKIDEEGYIQEIPEGFFDDSYNEAFEHLKYIIDKKKSNK